MQQALRPMVGAWFSRRALALAWLGALALTAALSLALSGVGPLGLTVDREVAFSTGPAVSPALSRLLDNKMQSLATLGLDRTAYAAVPFDGGFAAQNPAQSFRERFARSGVLIASGSRTTRLEVTAIGYGGHLRTLHPVAPRARRNEVIYDRRSLREWYVNRPSGLEQGFVVAQPPIAHPGSALTLQMEVAGDQHVSVGPSQQGDAAAGSAASSLRYTGLSATDARGRVLPGTVTFAGGSLRVRVDTRGAAYPVRIDPFIQQGKRLTATGEVPSGGEGNFGWDTALSTDGNTALVAAPFDLSGTSGGGVWVFARAGGEGEFSQQAELRGPETHEFGRQLSLSGDGKTALIGVGPREAWVYTNSRSTWSLQAKLRVAGNHLGGVALSTDGKTALIGMPGEGSNPGAAYAFIRIGETWIEQEKLEPTGAITSFNQGDAFGVSVALSAEGNTALIGDADDNGAVGAAWVFTRVGVKWLQQQKLTATNETGTGFFGHTLALSAEGNVALIGCPDDNEFRGSAYLFTLSGGSWTQRQRLTAIGAKPLRGELGPSFGNGVALSANGNSALVGAPGDGEGLGATYVFARSGEVLAQRAALMAHEPVGESDFGGSVAISGDGSTGLVGSPFEGLNAHHETERIGGAWAFINKETAPLVSAVTPDAGSKNGGDTVTITGSNFAGAREVHFGTERAASFTVDNPNTITAVTPAGAVGVVNVSVTTAEGTSADTTTGRYAYIGVPVVSRLGFDRGPESGGRSVAIEGEHLSGATEVRFGSSNAQSFTVVDDRVILAVAPPGTGTVDVTVTSPEGVSATGVQYFYEPPPRVTSISPSDGPQAGGTLVTIRGTQLTTNGTEVSFGSTKATSVQEISPELVKATAPPGVGTVDVIVTTGAGGPSAANEADRFTYVPRPTVTEVNPKVGPEAGGTAVTITGTHFTSGSTVKFANAPATSITVNSSESITAVSPAGSGAIDITVTTAGGTSATGRSDQFVYTPI